MSDHFSGPAVMGDPAVDITDFYAFPSPERPGNLVLIMDVFPMATSQSFFSDVVTYRFRLRPLTRSGGSITHGTAEYTIDVTFNDVPEGTSVQKGHVVTSDGREASFVVGEPLEQDGMRVFAGLVSDPFFMDVEAALRTDLSGKLSFNTAANTVQFRDVLSIVVEVPFAPIVERFDGITLVGAIAENIVTRRGKPIRIERLGRPEIKNFVLANPIAIRARRASSFATSTTGKTPSRSPRNIGRSTSRVSTRTWPSSMVSTVRLRGRSDADGRHPLRDLLIGDFLILDLAHAFAPGNFLEIERVADRQPTAQERRRSLAR